MSDHAAPAGTRVRDDPVARPWFGALASVVAAVALAATGEPVAVIAAGLVVLAWVWASAIAAFGVGQVGLAAVAGTASVESLLIAQGALVACLFVPAVRARRSIRHAVTTALALAGLGVIGGGAWFATGAVWVAAATAVVVTAVAAYLLHRYGLLTHGEISDE